MVANRHRKTAQERREQRLRAEARTASRPLRAFQEVHAHRGGQLSRLRMTLRALAGQMLEHIRQHIVEQIVFSPMQQVVISQERNPEHILEQTIDAPVPQDMKETEIEYVAPALAAIRRMCTAMRVALAVAAADAALAPVNMWLHHLPPPVRHQLQ